MARRSTAKGAAASAGKRPAGAPTPAEVRTLTIDIGGTGVKMLLTDAQGRATAERARELTPRPSTPEAVIAVARRMLDAQAPFDRVSVGFPGVVRGVVRTAPNLGTRQWRDFDLQGAIEEASGRPARVVNDADLQGYGVISGSGVELVLTLGTGLGSALYVNGRLVPNLELAHHPFRSGKTYEELVSNKALKRAGKKRWSKRVRDMIEQLDPIFNYDALHIGGGNAKHLKGALPPRVRIFQNVEGLAGG
ncbi:MAG TPA: ROK family protein, partial [Burkholderiales bacterium]|nr:ROK family protein [Burkholderiales bacterium]